MGDMLNYLPAAKSFLEPGRVGADRPEDARAVVIPFGLEATVSYGHGTALGPEAILSASQQLELFDDELMREAYLDYGIATLEPPTIAGSQAAALDQVGSLVGEVLDEGRFPLVLGGEHTLTAGAIDAVAARFDEVVILQIDAHPDLRESYDGERLSHAAAMYLSLQNPNVSLVTVGIRAVALEEADYIAAHGNRVHAHWAKDLAGRDGVPSMTPREIVAPLVGKSIYVSFDVDGLDGSIMPATGTPCPGGLGFWQAMSIVREAAKVGRIVAADVVELAPIPNFHLYDFTAALVAYKIMNYALSDGRST